MLLTIHELIDIIIMSLALGYLFKDMFKPPQPDYYDPLRVYNNKSSSAKNFWYATAIISPGIILHELSHKFTAMIFGIHATFHAFYANSTTLFLGIIAFIAKMTGFGLVFIVPGYVSFLPKASTTHLELALIALAGPLMNALLFLIALLVQKRAVRLSKQQAVFLQLFKYVNGFLFIINMLPIPGIDGFSVYSELLKHFF